MNEKIHLKKYSLYYIVFRSTIIVKQDNTIFSFIKDEIVF
jgi:hypothetical protein